VFWCRLALLALSLKGFGEMWLKSRLMASRLATSFGRTSQRVARVATPLSRFARVTISGQRYEVFDNCKGVGVCQIFVLLSRQAGGSAARTISAPVRGRFFLGRKVCAFTHYILAV
jgi:hypothetical protein